MPPRADQKLTSTDCTEGRACVEQPLLPQTIWLVTLKLPAASSQLSSYWALACAPAKNDAASLPTKVLSLIWSMACSVRVWRVYFVSFPPALSTEYGVRSGALSLPE